jgi:hypothetical protein
LFARGALHEVGAEAAGEDEKLAVGVRARESFAVTYLVAPPAIAAHSMK